MAGLKEMNTAVFRRAGAMFSNLWSVVGFLEWCESNSYVPVVDFQTVRPTNFWKSEEARNAWTDYFEQTSDRSLRSVLDSEDYFLFEGRPKGFPVSEYSQDSRFVAIFHERVRLNPFMQEYVSRWLEMLAQSGSVLGVHFRGTDMKVAKSHASPPTRFQMFKTIDEALERGSFDSILLATEDEGHFEATLKRYGAKVVTTDSFRTRETAKLARMESPILQWNYHLGCQVIRDAWLLGHCDGLVSGHSNVSEHAQVIARNSYSVNLQIRRLRVDLLDDRRGGIRVTNWLREYSSSRVPGPDFRLIDRSPKSPG